MYAKDQGHFIAFRKERIHAAIRAEMPMRRRQMEQEEEGIVLGIIRNLKGVR
jgi:hypothetical protein